jgi:hypothetical protein
MPFEWGGKEACGLPGPVLRVPGPFSFEIVRCQAGIWTGAFSLWTRSARIWADGFGNSAALPAPWT